jgi:plasmid stabilization system protein ParE
LKSQNLEIRILGVALREIADQATYYEQRENLRLAVRWQAAVDSTIQSLAQLSNRGTPSNFESTRLTHLRSLPIEGFQNHFLFYEFNALSSVITVFHVLHGARDLDSLL